ncbi:lupus La protein homolog isoform X2 [Saccoglossus kowalevskii]|uniref:Lupus La protein homolog isoform X3 n=1 Tax=Saccoglossus kowalevskii TaxID=10224 RepID=A0ABM0M7E4_SACKO|nr:PREDICTED: lupus La protein homolog isoform X3 [Saccoglossus kowalevskii]
MSANGDKSAESPSKLETKIIRQVEYYFGDANLRRDRFLQEKSKEDDGWISLETLVTFNRLKSLSTDFKVITGALKKSQSGLLEINEDELKLRRSTAKPLPEESDDLRADIKARSVYCKGFPSDATLDDIQEFFDGYGKVAFIQMRKTLDTKEFKGSVFATFEDEEAAKKFVEAEEIKFKDTETIRMLKNEYFKKKQEDRRKMRDDEKIKKVKDQEEKTKKAEEEAEQHYETGCILFFSGVSEQTSREDLNEVFDKHGNVKWIDFVRGQTEGYIRFEGKDEAKNASEKAKEANGGKITVKGNEITFKVLEGDEEKKKWLETYEQQNKVRQMKRMGRKRKPFKGRPARGRKEVKYEGKKTVFESDGESGDEGDHSPEGDTKADDDSEPMAGEKKDTKSVKRVLEGQGDEAPSTKQPRTEETSEQKAEVVAD